jgi:hypothetical protein
VNVHTVVPRNRPDSPACMRIVKDRGMNGRLHGTRHNKYDTLLTDFAGLAGIFLLCGHLDCRTFRPFDPAG